jgi:hypothetical protein
MTHVGEGTMEDFPSDGNNLPRGTMGWHWLWFVPLCVAVLLIPERHTVLHGFRLSKLAYQRWKWASLISPSAYVCWSTILFSIYFPLNGLWSVAAIVITGTKKRYLLLLVLAIFLFPLLTDAVTWGSFPFNVDNAGVHRLRLIPFIPWPDGRFGEY